MLSSVKTRVAVIVMMTATTAIANMYAIPTDQVDAKKVYWGATAGFEKAGEVDYEEVMKITPEIRQLKKDKIQRGTGKYWILMSQASERTTRAIADVGQNTDYDLIALQGYLATLTPAIPAEDVTELVVARLEGSKVLAQNKKSGKDDKQKDSDKRTAKADTKTEGKTKSKSETPSK